MIIWLFRSNLKNLEYYHNYKSLKEFKEKCHDFYLLQGIYFLENKICDEFIVFRLSDINIPDIIFNINGKKFIQKWVKSFKDVLKYQKPDISFFRGGFSEYCDATKINPGFFGLKLYLGAGKRIYPIYSGIYDKILIEDERDINQYLDCIPFYKTCNPNIFKPLNLKKEIDLCWIANFSQIRQKGQEFFISSIAKSSFLKTLNIVHIGNNKNIAIEMSSKYSVNNIKFLGSLERPDINIILNKSKFGIVTSNIEDGCPRVSTEVLCSGTPLIIRDSTRLLQYYRDSCICFSDKNIDKKIEESFNKDYVIDVNKYNMKTICDMNLKKWK